jgi:hypothetical protein
MLILLYQQGGKIFKIGKMKKLIKFILVPLVVITVGFVVFFYKSNLEKTGEVGGVSSEKSENEGYSSLLVDVDGDGIKEKVEIVVDDEIEFGMNTTLNVYDQQNNLVAGFPSEISLLQPIEGSFRTYKLNSNEISESFSFDFTTGPHQSERMFFEVYEDRIIPVCFKERFMGPKDCLFYSAKSDEGLFVGDLDGDGYVELVEYADEYPTDGELTEEEEMAITQAFDEQGVTEFTSGAERIAKREKGGRGRIVVWAIYSYDGIYFEPQIEDDYEGHFLTLESSRPEVIRKSDLSIESLEYNEFVRIFWN